MSEDRLQEARNMNDMNLTSEQVDIFEWLISELEAARDAGSAKKACMKAALNQLKIRTQELKECKAEVDTLSIAIAGVGGAFEKQRRHRKWALKELKEKQALWRNYCGEVSEQMNEVKRLKAMLAIGHFVIRE